MKQIEFLSGQDRYSVFIEPILITNNQPGFIEKSIPFAFQRHSNLHATDFVHLPSLIDYIQTKYVVLTTYGKSEAPEKALKKSSEQLIQRIRLLSLVLLCYGVMFAIIIFAKLYILLPLFLNIGYISTGAYILLYFYISFNYIKIKRKYNTNLDDPYYSQLKLDDTDIFLIEQEFTDELMLQFGYECSLQEVENNILQKIEAKAVKKPIITEKEGHDLDEIENQQSETLVNSVPSNHLLEKYSSFLDD
jgi:hypothetical protein